jgi:WD40 repeat protein
MNHIAVAGKAIRIIEIEQNTNTLPIILAHPISKSSVKQMVALDLNTLVCANDKNLFVWNIASKTLTSNISAPGIVRLHQIDNDQFVVVVKNVVVVYNRRLTVLHTYSMREQIITSISSKILYFMGAVSGTCRLILNTGDQQTISKYNGLDLCVINKYIITAVFGGLCVSNMDAVSLYTIPDHSSGASHIDDKLLYVDKEYNVVLYDLELRAPIRMYKGVSEPVSKLAAIKRDERKLYNKEKNKTLHVPL